MENMENEIMYIKLDDIIPNRFQPREVFDEVALNELSESIRQHGVIQPIIVRQVGNKYEIIAGERRYKASALAGLTKIPAIIKNVDDKESSIVAYIENAQRRNVSAIEEARTSERILKTNNMTQEQLARELGISQSALANKLRLLSLPMEVQEALMKNEISERHARSLLSVKEPEKQIELLDRIKTNKMTVRELDGEIKNMYGNNMNNGINQFIPNTNDMNNNFNNSIPTFNQPISTFDNNMMTNNEIYNSNIAPVQPIVDTNPTLNVDNNDFLNFANSFDPSKYEKNYVESNVDMGANNNNNNNIPTVQPAQDNVSFADFLDGYDNNYPNAVNEYSTPVENNNTTNEIPGNDDFMSYLNNYDNNAPVVSSVAPVTPSNDDFMNYLNNYDNNNNQPAVQNVAPTAPSNDFMNYLNDYDNNNVVQEQPVNYNPTPQPVNNPIINNVVPPVTSNFGATAPKYVEEDVRYQDVSKPNTLGSIEQIIGELQSVVNNIKNNSKFKIDTDEINFDDIYQITIKIDKRDIL